jgi:AbrB family looped-hinge helix DNA binding protein
MDTVTLGSKGQVSIPKPALRRLGLEGGAILLVETTPDGAIVLRPAGVYPLEIYDEDRLQEFEVADRIAPETAKRLKRALAKRKR